jgi:hypothetical protein
VNLRFTLTNNSDTRLYVLKWYTPLEGLAGEILHIERDGQVIPYQGILASRDTPSPDAYVLLDAGKSVSAEVDLATAYDFAEAGEYTIEFLSPKSSHIARSEATMAKTLDDLGPVQMPSNRATVEIGRVSAFATVAATATAIAAQSTSMATSTATAIPTATAPIAPTATPCRLSFEPTTYRDERAGFEFEYPRLWSLCFQEEHSRGYAANLCEASPDQPNLSITVALWEPHNLDDYASQREQAWISSDATVQSREEWLLDGEHRAVRYLIRGRAGERVFVLITTVGERYLVLAGDGELDLLAEIAHTVRFFEPTESSPAGRPEEPDPKLDMTLARQGLETYFALLHGGCYTEAVAYYGGEYQVLRDWNPAVAHDDYAKLLENGCTVNGLQCLPVKEIAVQEEVSPVAYRFVVSFENHDGSTFVRAPSTELFAFAVLKVDDRFLVQDLPVYTP